MSKWTGTTVMLDKAYKPPVFYRNSMEIEQDSGKNPYSHYMRRAWNAMRLSGIYCINKKPAVYFKQVDKINLDEVHLLHKQFWNQGIAALLVLVSKTEIHVYSGLVPPTNPQSKKQDKGLIPVQVLENTAEGIEIYRLIQRIETGIIYQKNQHHFNSKNAVDQYLLRNLGALRDRIANTAQKTKEIVHQLLGRLIFTCYLIDRQIIGCRQFIEAGADPGHNIKNFKDLFTQYDAPEAKKIMYCLFDDLQTYFNGSMFDARLELEKEVFDDQDISYLKDFFSGQEIESGQLSLDFWAYDFSIIPVETISAIYENFLAEENKKEENNAQRSTGAYYTPNHLAEMVVDVAVAGWEGCLLDKRFLDPACGSGIFLVILFNRLAEEWRYKNPQAENLDRAKALTEILQTRLCGIDISETACRITCFSLYIALLDQLEPRDIHALKEVYGYVLVKLLALQTEYCEDNGSSSIYQGNFFDPELPIAADFDLAIGNPPWVGRGQAEDKQAKAWYSSDLNPFLKQVSKQKRDICFRPEKQIAHVFMWKIPLHIKTEGKACLLLPSKVFLNQKTNNFQKLWLKHFTLEKVIQLADMRFLLFENALCPSVITKFLPQKPDSEYFFEYEIPKASLRDPRLGVVTVLAEDCHRVSSSEIISSACQEESTEAPEAPIVWKKYFWGTLHGNELLEWLSAYPRLGRMIDEKDKQRKGWSKGQGFKPFKLESYKKNPEAYGKPKPIWWKPDALFLDAAKKRKTGLVLCQDGLEQVKVNKKSKDIKSLHRSPDELLFKPPMVLINQGCTWKAFCDFPVLFQHSIQSIKGRSADRKLLMFLAAVLNSKLADYFLFHTSANWGTERDKVHFFELLRLPFPLPEETDNPERSTLILDEVEEHITQLKNELETAILGQSNRVERTNLILEPLIYEYYGISPRQQIIIEDTVNIFEPGATPHSLKGNIPTLRQVSADERKQHVELVCEVLNELAKYSPVKVSGAVSVSRGAGLSIVTLTKGTDIFSYMEEPADDRFDNILKRIKKIMPDTQSRFSYIQNIKVFDANNLYIIKPNIMRYWTQTMALNDAREIVTSILMAKGV